MTAVTPEQFAESVAAAIAGVQHLYRELDRLLVGLRDGLAEEPQSLAPVRGATVKSSKDQGRLVIRNEYGLLFEARPLDEEDLDDDEEEEGDDDADDAEEEESPEGKSKKKPIELSADQPLLAIRVAMFDPTKREAVQPKIEFAVMSDWAVGGVGPVDGQAYQLRSSMLRKIPRALSLAGTVGNNGRLQTAAMVKGGKGKKGIARRLSCRLPAGAASEPLYSLQSADDLDRLVKRIKEMWALGVPRGTVSL